jgi:hypothetical protein
MSHCSPQESVSSLTVDLARMHIPAFVAERRRPGQHRLDAHPHMHTACSRTHHDRTWRGLFQHSCRLRWVHHLIDDSGSWDETAIRRYFYPCDVVEIFKIKLPVQETEDFVAWHFEKTGIFSVYSAYRLAVRNFYGVGNIESISSSDQGRSVGRN